MAHSVAAWNVDVEAVLTLRMRSGTWRQLSETAARMAERLGGAMGGGARDLEVPLRCSRRRVARWIAELEADPSYTRAARRVR